MASAYVGDESHDRMIVCGNVFGTSFAASLAGRHGGPPSSQG